MSSIQDRINRMKSGSNTQSSDKKKDNQQTVQQRINNMKVSQNDTSSSLQISANTASSGPLGSSSLNAKNRLSGRGVSGVSGSFPISSEGEAAYERGVVSAINRERDDAKMDQIRSQARLQALSAGGWSPSSPQAQQAEQETRNSLDAASRLRDANARLKEIAASSQERYAIQQAARAARLPDSDTLEDRLEQAARERYQAEADIQRYSGLGLLLSGGGIQQNAEKLRSAVQSLAPAREEQKSLESDLDLARNRDYQRESQERIQELLEGAQGGSGTYESPDYATARNPRQWQAAQAVRTILNPDQAANVAASGYAEGTWNATRLSFLTDTEKNAILSYANAGDWESVSDLLEALERTLNERQQGSANERAYQESLENPVLGAAANAVLTYGQPAAYVEGWRQVLENAITGEYEPIDTNGFAMSGTNLVQQTGQGVVDAVNNYFGQDVSFLTQTGLSILQNMARAPIAAVAPGVSLGIMATGAGGASVLENAQNGMNPWETMALATASGFAEYITEKVSLEALLETLKAGATPLRQTLFSIGKQIVTEGSEEAASEYLNLIADAVIRGANSDMMQYRDALVAAGFSQKQADAMAVTEYMVNQPALSALGGAISGGVMGGGAATLGNTMGRGLDYLDTTAARQSARTADTAIDASYAQMQENGLFGQSEAQRQRTRSAIDEANYRNALTMRAGEDTITQQQAQAIEKIISGEQVSEEEERSISESDMATEVITRMMDERTASNREQQTVSAPQQTRENARPAATVRQRQVLDASSVFGENGQKAAQASYDGSISADRYLSGFAEYYEAGLSGLSMDQAQGRYGRALNEAQRLAAYDSGRQDAALNLRNEQARAQYASVAGEDSGLVLDDYVQQNLDNDTVRRLNEVSKALGVRVQFVDSVAGGRANAAITGSTIQVEKGNQNPVNFLLGHEWTHRMQELAPEQYRAFRSAIADEIQYDARVKLERYRSAGVDADLDYALDEAAADYAGRLMKDGKLMDDFIRRHGNDRNLLQKMLDAIRTIIRKLTGKDKNVLNGEEKQHLMEVKEKLMRALEAASDQAIQNQIKYLSTQEGQKIELSDVNTKYSIRKKDPPKKTGVAYKVFFAKDGQLYPPMVANPGGEGTPVGVWLDADIGKAAPPSKTGRMQVQAGGKGTNAAKGSLAFRPGWHLGDIPLAKQFARKNPETGVKDLFPSDFVWAECEYAMDVDYQEEAMSYGYTENGKFRHSYAGLPKLPTDGYYRYRTNPNPDTVPWIITGAMRVRRILTDAETDAICREAGVEPMQRQGGPMDDEKLASLGLEAGDVAGNTRFSMKKILEEEESVITPGTQLIDGSAVKYSLSTWTEKERSTVKKSLLKAGFEEADIEKWISDVDSISSIVAADKERLDFDAAENQKMLKDNQEYIKTLDASTLCAKRLIYQGTFNAIQHKLPNTALLSDDLLRLLNMMNKKGYETPCGVCYVESRRRNLGKFASKWLSDYNGEYIPTLDQVTTTDGLEKLRKIHPETYSDFISGMRKIGVNNPKVVELRTEYRGDVRKLTSRTVKSLNDMGGLRIQSFSDFETPHLLDMMQAVMDMSAKGLKSQAYTKVPDFAWVFGDTGIKINLSLIAEGNGLDKNGNLIFSNKEGMDIDQAVALRERYPENVGTILVGVNDDHILAAMADDRIDFIIPFHKSGWGENELRMMGMEEYVDYSSDQNEKLISTGKRADGNIYPSEYWDYSISGKENAEQYLRICAERGLIPKFSKFLHNNGDGSWSLQNDGSTDGYWKLLIDFKMYDNDGIGTPQNSVMPNFNMDEAFRVLSEYEGGANSLPVANDIVDEFVREYKKSKSSIDQDIRYSLKQEDTQADDYINPEYIIPVNDVTNQGLYEYLVKQYSESGYSGRPIVVLNDGNNGYTALTGSHRIIAAREAGISVPAIVIQNSEAYDRLREVYRDDELANTAEDLYEEGLLRDVERYLLVREEELNNENYDVPYNEQMRYSLKAGDNSRTAADLRREADLLRERMEYWKGQTRRSTQETVDKKAVRKAARSIAKEFSSQIDLDTLTEALESTYNYFLKGGKDFSADQADEMVNSLARDIVDAALETDDSFYRQYADLRSYLRNAKFRISREYTSDLLDFNDFRKRNFGRFSVGIGETNVDQYYAEMSELWPELFNQEREMHPAEQLMHIEEVMNQINKVIEGNPFSSDYLEAVQAAYNEILEQFTEMPQTKPTFADRQAEKLETERQRGRERLGRQRERYETKLQELREKNKERVQKVIQRERDTRSRQIDRLKSRFQAKQADQRERQNARVLRNRIIRHANDLSRKLLTPNNKQHIPENLRTAVAATLDAINMESLYTYDPETGERRKNKPGNPTRRTEAFQSLREAYQEILDNESMGSSVVVDPEMQSNLDELIKLRNTPLAAMNTQQLTTVWNTLKAVEASVKTANKMFIQQQWETVNETARALRRDNQNKQQRRDFAGPLGALDKAVNINNLTPEAFFHRLGNTGEKMFKALRQAQDRHITIMADAQAAISKMVNGKTVQQLEKDAHVFHLNSGTVTMSTAQIMSLYELAQREQGRKHILNGGIRPDNIQRSRFGYKTAASKSYAVTAEELSTILSTLTNEQADLADKLQHYLANEMSELGNETSMAVYGYRKFTEKNYFPIDVDRNQTQTEVAAGGQDRTIENLGMTKSTDPNATNGLMLHSIFDVTSQHINDMATYAAYLPAILDTQRIYNYQFYRDATEDDVKTGKVRDGSVKDIFSWVFGENGNPYMNKLLKDINRSSRSENMSPLSALTGNYKAASIAFNMRVVLQQPTAILRALNMIDSKYLAEGIVHRGDWEKVRKYAPIAVWKDWGYFDINTGRQMKNVLFSDDSTLEKLKQAGMAMAGKADSFAWSRLWNAVEAETRDKRSDLKPGSSDFYEAVAERFNDIIDRTQVVDGILQRSQIMRSTGALDKMAASFMSEPTKTYNMFMSAVYDYRTAFTKGDKAKAKKQLSRTVIALTISFAANAVMQSIMDALRDDDKEKDYWEKFFSAYSGLSGDEDSFLDYWNSFWDGNLVANYNPLSYVPYIKDVLSLLQGYDVKRMDLESISRVITALQTTFKSLQGGGKSSRMSAWANLFSEVSRLFGLPVANVKRDVLATIKTAAIETDSFVLQYRIDKASLNMNYASNKSTFTETLFNALAAGDMEAYDFIRTDLIESGMFDGASLDSAMRTRYKNAVEKDPDFTIPQDALDLIGARENYSSGESSTETPDSFGSDDLGAEAYRDYSRQQASDYREWADTIEAFSGFDRLDDETKDSVLKAAQQLAQDIALRDHSEGQFTDADLSQWERWATGGSAYGVSEAEAILFKAAYDMSVSDKDEEGKTISGSKKENTLDLAEELMPNLTDRELEYLLAQFWTPEDDALKAMKENKFMD